jgi:serine/threonine protein kinase
MASETLMDENGKFEYIKELGRGSFGAVVLARNTRTGENVAIKKMERAHLQVSSRLGAWGQEAALANVTVSVVMLAVTGCQEQSRQH